MFSEGRRIFGIVIADPWPYLHSVINITTKVQASQYFIFVPPVFQIDTRE